MMTMDCKTLYYTRPGTELNLLSNDSVPHLRDYLNASPSRLNSNDVTCVPFFIYNRHLSARIEYVQNNWQTIVHHLDANLDSSVFLAFVNTVFVPTVILFPDVFFGIGALGNVTDSSLAIYVYSSSYIIRRFDNSDLFWICESVRKKLVPVYSDLNDDINLICTPQRAVTHVSPPPAHYQTAPLAMIMCLLILSLLIVVLFIVNKPLEESHENLYVELGPQITSPTLISATRTLEDCVSLTSFENENK